MKWEEFKTRDLKYLNLGGGKDNHSSPNYKNYISVQIPRGIYQHKNIGITNKGVALIDFERQTLGCYEDYTIYHDIQNTFPIEDGIIDRVLSEDCIEHIEEKFYTNIFNEIYRILKPGSFFRLSCPDYMHPSSRFCLKQGFDPRDMMHITMTTKKLLEHYISKSSFTKIKWLHYWNENEFIYENIDYNLGYVKRTPDNDRRNKIDIINDGKKIYQSKFIVTSIVVDLIK